MFFRSCVDYLLCIIQEEDLRAANDPKYQHLHEDLHVEITAFAPPAEAHARIAYALTEVFNHRKTIVINEPGRIVETALT